MNKNTRNRCLLPDINPKMAFIRRLSSLSLATLLFAPALSADIKSLEVKAAYEPEANSVRRLDSSSLDCSLPSEHFDKSDDKKANELCVSNIKPTNSLAQSFLPQLLSGSGISPWVLVGGAGAGLAAAAGGGGGGGGGDGGDSQASTASVPYLTIESTDPNIYITEEYRNRSDLETINANEAYANIARKVAADSNSSSGAIAATLSTGATHGGEGITIAILDTGVDVNHVNISGNISTTCTSNDCKEHLAAGDPDGHGTHVAGIAAGGRTGQDFSMHGVAYNATILAGCAYVGEGCYTSPVGDGELMQWAANHGAMVANMSYGYTQGYRGKVVTDITGGTKDYTYAGLKSYLFGSYSSSPNRDYQKAKSALEQGLVTTIAAGNTLVSAPENLQPSVMAVAPLIYGDTDLKDDLAYQWIAVVNTDNNGRLSNSSHACGDAAEFCLAAPGSSIFSTLPGNSYGYLSGTSMAAPQVAGGVALIAGAFPSLSLPSSHQYSSVCDSGSSEFNSKQCHSKAVVNRLFVTAMDLGVAGVDAIYGNGMMNLQAATSLVGTAQLQSASGAVYALSGSALNTSSATASNIASQLESVHFLAMDSYDNAGFIYNGQALLGADNEVDTRIDTLQYLNRSMRRQSLSSTALSPAMTFSFSYTSGSNDLNKGHYQLSYAFSDISSMDVGYGFSEHKDFSVGGYQHLNVDNLSASQAFDTPMSHFSENAHSMGFRQVIADGYSVTANLRQGEISEAFSNEAESLKTTSMTLALNGELTRRLKGSLIAGTLSEEESVLGNHGSGLWEVGDGSESLMAGINLSYELMPSVTALFSYYKLSTEAEQSNDLVRYSDNLVSDSFSFGLVAQEDSHWQYGIFATQPVRMHDGQATLSLPSSYNGRSLNYSDIDLDLAPEGQHMEYEFAVSWTPESLPVTGKFNLIRVEDYGNIVGNNDNIALFSLGMPF